MSDQGWSTTHGFFVIMGGFHLFEHGSIETSNNDKAILHDNDIPLRPLAACDLYEDRAYRSIKADIDFTSFTVPTEEEIKDKGKSDWLAKSLVLLQTLWFVMQCIARAVGRLPVTHLEIVTLAYAAMNFVIYIFWWNKPLNINRPVRVFRKSGPSATQPRAWNPEPWYGQNNARRIVMYIAGNQDDDIILKYEERVPRFWADSDETDAERADKIVLGVGVCFGAIHCISWGFSFPTHTELLIWRVSCAAITSVPFYITLGFYLGNWLDYMGFGVTVLGFFPLSGGLLYILARAVTLTLAFTSLRDLPPGTYETVHWTTFIPHV